jgi:hypothetical protein
MLKPLGFAQAAMAVRRVPVKLSDNLVKLTLFLLIEKSIQKKKLK